MDWVEGDEIFVLESLDWGSTSRGTGFIAGGGIKSRQEGVFVRETVFP